MHYEMQLDQTEEYLEHDVQIMKVVHDEFSLLERRGVCNLF